MEYTENLTLALVGDDDLFDEAYLNANFEKIDAAYAELSQRSGGSAPALASAVADGLFGAVGHAERVTVAKYDISGLEWEQGWYSASNSNSGTSVGEIRTTLYLDISGLTDFLNYTYTVKGQCGDKQCKFGVMFYDADFNVIKPTGNVTDWTTYGTQVKYTLGAAPTYARFTLQNPNGYSQSMAPSELTSATFEVYP